MLRRLGKLYSRSCGIDLFRSQHPEAEPCASACLTLHQFAEALGNAVDARDPQLYNHSHDVAETGRILATGMGFSPTETELIHRY